MVDAGSYYWTRFFILRLLGLVYVFAFLALIRQFKPLLGQGGLTPISDLLAHAGGGSRWEAFARVPSLFWWKSSDAFMLGVAWLGLGLSAMLLLGFANQITLLLLWFVYLSFIPLGQVWYGYGWELQLVETGFLAIFLVPLFNLHPFPSQSPPQTVVWLFRWLICRIMLGAALIKLRGDACWRDLSCLDYHFETQPLPNPLSPYFHFLPRWMLRGGVLFNYLAELVAPFFGMLPWAWARVPAGLLMGGLQGVLILSGNLSFLNWLTLVPVLACFDDRQWQAVMPDALWRLAMPGAAQGPGPVWSLAAWGLFALVAWLSIDPVKNLFSSHQAMNQSFGNLPLVNTYGAFGSVGKERLQLVLEGSQAERPADKDWVPYVHKCQPGPLDRAPCVCAPYQHRLDWQIWFAAMSQPQYEPWVFPLLWKLLQGDAATLGLFAADPFAGKAPRWVRMRLFKYEFEDLKHPGGRWWKRKELGTWLPPLSLESNELKNVIRQLGRMDLLGPRI